MSEYASAPEFKEQKRQQMLNRWANDDGTLLEQAMINVKAMHTPQAKAKMKASLRTEAYRAKKSQIMSEFHKNNPKYKEAQKLAWQRHPEITEKMAQIAQRYPTLPDIIKKRHNGIELNEAEKYINAGYFKECLSVMPNFHKIIGQEVHNILIEWGLKEE